MIVNNLVTAHAFYVNSYAFLNVGVFLNVGYFFVPGPLGGLKSVSGDVFGHTDSIGIF